jgi:cystathionine beta-synthase
VVTLVCDSGNKYLSKMFNDHWMTDQGLGQRASFGDLRDLIPRRFADGAVVSVGPNEPLAIAYRRMRMYDVSQLPAVEGGKIVGLVDESDLLLALSNHPAGFSQPVRHFMSTNLEKVPPSATLERLQPIFEAGRVAIVADEVGFYGLITRVDVLNHLRRQMAA